MLFLLSKGFIFKGLYKNCKFLSQQKLSPHWEKAIVGLSTTLILSSSDKIRGLLQEVWSLLQQNTGCWQYSSSHRGKTLENLHSAELIVRGELNQTNFSKYIFKKFIFGANHKKSPKKENPTTMPLRRKRNNNDLLLFFANPVCKWHTEFLLRLN